MTYGELVAQLQAEVLADRLDRGDAIDRLHQHADGGLTWEGAAMVFAASPARRVLDLDAQPNATL